jgi:hypothetical protein
MTTYCNDCEQMVPTDAVHSCFPASQLRAVQDARAAVVDAARVFDALVNDHGWSRGAGLDGVVTLSTGSPRTLATAITELMEAVRSLDAAEGGRG